ncbi:MAG: hypothetical protein V4757_23165 [Pseudomonadota bacterium]
MTFKNLHMSVLIAGLLAFSGFAAAQVPAKGAADNTDSKLKAAAPAAGTSGMARADVKAEAKTGMNAKTGEGTDIAATKAVKKPTKKKAAKTRAAVKAETKAGAKVKTAEGTDLGKK